VKRRGYARGAARTLEGLTIALHLPVDSERVEEAIENASLSPIRRPDDAVVHPLSVAARLDDAGASQIREMPRDLRLRLVQHLDEVTHADLTFSHQIQEAQTRAITERLEERCEVVLHAISIRFNVPRSLARWGIEW
jgi:hypothetical protein